MTLTLTTDQARRDWREVIEKTYMEKAEVVIRRYNKPVSVVVNYDVWQMLKKQRLELLERLSQEIDEGKYFTQEEVDAGLRERGLV
jgi:PHD/YefM family antitoxin component YafN of YafNO toxin-antitoxin module